MRRRHTVKGHGTSPSLSSRARKPGAGTLLDKDAASRRDGDLLTSVRHFGSFVSAELGQKAS